MHAGHWVVDGFPLRQLVQCASCGKGLTASFAQGRAECGDCGKKLMRDKGKPWKKCSRCGSDKVAINKHARYWCWNKECTRRTGVDRETLESGFVDLLGKLKSFAMILAKLPEIATREWEERKGRIAEDAKTLARKREEQVGLNQRATRFLLDGKISEEDAREMKESVKAELRRIDEQIAALDKERTSLEDLKTELKVDALDFVKAWQNADINKRRELVKALFPQGLRYNSAEKYFEPQHFDPKSFRYNWIGNRLWKIPPTSANWHFEPTLADLTDEEMRLLESLPDDSESENMVGVPDGI